MKVVLASNNKGKIQEFGAWLQSFHIELIPQAALGVEEIEETGLSFIENALLKARHASKVTGLPALSDDSGLAVNALKGAPGIYSARYAGIQSSDADNIQKLLAELNNVPDDKRQASYHCVLVFMTHDKDPTPLVCDAEWHGTILREPKGLHGFGYDPVFYIPAKKMSAAELSPQDKHQISHRGIALNALINKIAKKL
jgi:XTP/dITP diphosphohydrolase